MNLNLFGASSSEVSVMVCCFTDVILLSSFTMCVFAETYLLRYRQLRLDYVASRYLRGGGKGKEGYTELDF